LLSWHIYPKNY
ncbi:hypothetical protein BV054_00944B, partial [Haemophilus influenzae]